jgi:hypothetical protein
MKKIFLNTVLLTLISCQTVDWEDKIESEKTIQKYFEYSIDKYLDSLSSAISIYKLDKSPYSFTKALYINDKTLEYSDLLLTYIYRYENRIDKDLIDRFGKHSIYQPDFNDNLPISSRLKSRKEIIEFCNHMHYSYFNTIINFNNLNAKSDIKITRPDSVLVEARNYIKNIIAKAKKWPVKVEGTNYSEFEINWLNKAEITLDLLSTEIIPSSWQKRDYGNGFNLSLPKDINRVGVSDIDKSNIITFNNYEGIINGMLIRINTLETKNEIAADLNVMANQGLNIYSSNQSAKIIQDVKTSTWNIGEYDGIRQESILEFDNILGKVKRTSFIFKNYSKFCDITFEHSDSDLLSQFVSDRIISSITFE